MTRSALACLPAALRSAFIGVLALAHAMADAFHGATPLATGAGR